MKITLYLNPGVAPDAAAEQVRQSIESNIGFRCNIRVSYAGSVLSSNNLASRASEIVRENNALNIM